MNEPLIQRVRKKLLKRGVSEAGLSETELTLTVACTTDEYQSRKRLDHSPNP